MSELGTVLSWNNAEGHGRILADAGELRWTHYTFIASDGFDELEPGQRVEFTPVSDKEAPSDEPRQAWNVIPLVDQELAQAAAALGGSGRLDWQKRLINYYDHIAFPERTHRRSDVIWALWKVPRDIHAVGDFERFWGCPCDYCARQVRVEKQERRWRTVTG
ncbi:MAG: cold shock domain-containing protein [Vicinamibacterales bacterium]